MKKTILFLALTVTIILTTSCSSSEDDNNVNTLNGTRWEAYEVDKDISFEYKSTITFKKESYNIEISETVGGKEIKYSGAGTYTYEHPNITMTEDGETTKATIKGNKMITYYKGEEDVIYIKQ